MKINVIFLLISGCLVSTGISSEGSDVNGTLTDSEKKPDDVWIWDGTTNTFTTQTLIKPESHKQEEENPCLRPPLFKPDFKASGKSISVQKCDEYKWNREAREYERQMIRDCETYNLKHRRDDNHGVPEVVGGRLTLPREYLHMGAVGWKAAVGTWIFKCGSTLISPNFVLTAAHCTRTSHLDDSVSDVVPKIIRFSDGSLSDDIFPAESSDRNIIRIIPHPQYKSPKKYNDIALMEIEQPKLLFPGLPKVGFTSKIHEACLWSDEDTSKLGTKATVTGWGVFESGPGIASIKTSLELQVATVDIIDSQTCDELLKPKHSRHWHGLQDTQICAGVLEGGVDTCQGDSGGPLQVRISPSSYDEGGLYYVIGVTSFGFKCAQENTPAVYTRVSKYLDWIEGIVWPDEVTSAPLDA